MISIAKENASRKIDTLGRVSIPKGMRDRLVIAEGATITEAVKDVLREKGIILKAASAN